MNIVELIPFWLVIGAVLGALAHRFILIAAHTSLWLDLGVVFSILDVPPVANFNA